jgi:hypothetical protein
VHAFINAHGLPSDVIAKDDTTRTTAELWDLAPFTNFDAYDDKHFGNVWCNRKGNYCAVVAPAYIELTEYHQSKKASAKTKLSIKFFNVLRWDGKEWALDASFK